MTTNNNGDNRQNNNEKTGADRFFERKARREGWAKKK